MALILKIQEFHFGFADMENKERKVFHVISVATIARLASSYFNGDG